MCFFFIVGVSVGVFVSLAAVEGSYHRDVAASPPFRRLGRHQLYQEGRRLSLNGWSLGALGVLVPALRSERTGEKLTFFGLIVIGLLVLILTFFWRLLKQIQEKGDVTHLKRGFQLLWLHVLQQFCPSG